MTTEHKPHSSVDALRDRLYAALRHEKSCTCGECSGGLNAVDSLVAQVEQKSRNVFDNAAIALNRQEAKINRLQEQLESARADSARAVYIAENLFQMIDPQTWRDSGGDDGQGHYEGEYRAEQLREELVSLAAANSATEPDPTEGLPPDLARILCDPTIIIDRDHEIRLADGRTLFEHIHEWQNAPSNTAGTLPRHGVQSASEKERDDPNPATAPEVDDG